MDLNQSGANWYSVARRTAGVWGAWEAVTAYSSGGDEASKQISAAITMIENNSAYSIPYNYNSDRNEISFLLPVRQVKTVVEDFEISVDKRDFTFEDIDVVVDGKVSSLIVKVRPPDSPDFETWTEYNSLYLMDEDTKGYVSRRTDTGRLLSFGNSNHDLQFEYSQEKPNVHLVIYYLVLSRPETDFIFKQKLTTD